MAKARTIYIWEGPDTITITRGFPMSRSDKVPYLFNTKVKYKGLFQQFFPVMNTNQTYIAKPKKLIVKDTIMDGWEVVKVMKDFLTHEPYTTDIPPALEAQLTSLRNENEMWKRKYFAAVRLNEDREQKDRYRSRILDDAKNMAQVKNQFFGQDGGFGSPFFTNRWGVSPMGGGSPSNDGDG